MSLSYILLLLNILLLVSGQILWKIGVENIAEWNVSTIYILMRSPYIIGGCFLYVIAVGMWFYVISKLPFSVAYPCQSLSYVLGVFIAYFLFKEHVELTKWLGIAIIMLGVYLVAR